MILCYDNDAYIIQYSLIKRSLTPTCVGIASVFALDLGWVCVYPMETKGKANIALFLMFQHEGVLLSMVMDSSKEQTLGKFHQKLVDAQCQLKQTDSYSHCLNAAEREIKELKNGSRCKMRCCYDDCLDLEAFIHLHSA